MDVSTVGEEVEGIVAGAKVVGRLVGWFVIVVVVGFSVKVGAFEGVDVGNCVGGAVACVTDGF